MDVRAVRQELLEVTERLVREHDEVPAGSVIRCVARCRDELLALGLRAGLVEAVEAMARRRLRDRTGGAGLVPAQRADAARDDAARTDAARADAARADAARTDAARTAVAGCRS